MIKRKKQKIRKSRLLANIANVVTIALIIECFLCSIMVVRLYAKNDCFDRIEEATEQMGEMFKHHMTESRNKLTVFADILATNSSNPDEQLKIYMENFCRTQFFSAVCIHRADGSTVYYGEHPHDDIVLPAFAEEAQRLPYISEVFSRGNEPENKSFYQAVPIIRNGETAGILYGYMTLDIFSEFIASTAYDGSCSFYIVDGDTGDMLMDKDKDNLGNIYDGSMKEPEVKSGYDYDEMRSDIRQGEPGYLVFRTPSSSEWYYTYYAPLGINNWSMQLTIDEDTAFDSYNDVSRTVMVLAACVVVLMFIHVLVLMAQTARSNKRDRDNLRRSEYINKVQSSLINAHNNPEYIERALKTIAMELGAETVMLLTFEDYIVKDNYYWPSKDSYQATNLLGRNIRADFPVIFDLLRENSGISLKGDGSDVELSDTALEIFRAFDVRNVMMVPVLDNMGMLRGTVCAVNVPETLRDCSLLECVTYDFFMAITNVENHSIIKKMGAMDYLTNIKNRNSFESEVAAYATMDCGNLWCAYVDVNGLHEVNNAMGHKAGDLMLRAVADAVKKNFGEDMSYRTGGDEFVAFAVDTDEERLARTKRLINTELGIRGYNVSIGFSGTAQRRDGLFDVETILSEAEERMYEEKRAYYRSRGMDERRI